MRKGIPQNHTGFKISYIYEHAFSEARWWEKKFADVIEFDELVKFLKRKNIRNVDFFYNVKHYPYTEVRDFGYAVGYIEKLRANGIQVDHFYSPWLSSSSFLEYDENDEIIDYIKDHTAALNQFLENRQRADSIHNL